MGRWLDWVVRVPAQAVCALRRVMVSCLGKPPSYLTTSLSHAGQTLKLVVSFFVRKANAGCPCLSLV